MNQKDPGLQPQRTFLAWSRTGLSVFINALIVLRPAGNAHHGLLFALGMGLLLASVIVAICGLIRSAALSSGLEPAGPPWLMVVSVTTACLAAAIAGMLCIIAT